jgi:hypothetical protein
MRQPVSTDRVGVQHLPARPTWEGHAWAWLREYGPGCILLVIVLNKKTLEKMKHLIFDQLHIKILKYVTPN